MLYAYEGYLEQGRVYTMGQLESIRGRRRVIITVLDEPIRETPDTWADLDKIISGMSEKPRLEDFPRGQFERQSIVFNDEV